MTPIIYEELREAQRVLTTFYNDDNNIKAIEDAATIMIESLKAGGKIIVCGNGGSMSDAMHFAAELTGNFEKRRAPLAAMAICDPAHLSCVANDYGYEDVFARMITAHAKPEDVVLMISTSGTSKNIVHSCTLIPPNCKKVLLTGPLPSSTISVNCDAVVQVKSTIQTKHIQEMHIKIIHIWVQLIERGLGYV